VTLPIGLADVRAAADALRGHVHRTPLLSARSLGADVFLKAELLQRSGSFKLRGAYVRSLALDAEERAHGVVTVSAGNHAAALALAAREVGTHALVLMPRGASEAKAAAARRYGAEVDLDSADAAEAFARMAEIRAASGRVVVHPFDDPLVMAGQGTLGLELHEDLPGLAAVVVPVGGGGLAAGVATAVKALAPAARVVAVQARALASLAASLAAGEPVPRRTEPSVADALTPPSVGRGPLAVRAELVDDVVEVSEDEIAAAFRAVYAQAKLACEPGGAVAVAALLGGHVAVTGPTALVVSGGNVSPDVAARLLAG
jgi:threonine dehydratase